MIQSSNIILAKPHPGVTIDYGNPISQGLWCSYFFNEAGGKEVFDCSGNDAGILSFTGVDPEWQSDGLAVGNGKGYVRNNKTVTSEYNPVAGSHTVRVMHIPRTLPGAFTALLDVAGTAGSGRILNIFFDTSGNISYRGIGGGDGGAVANTYGMTAGEVCDLVWVRAFGDTTAGGNHTFYWYKNGVLNFSENGPSPANWNSWPTDGYDFAAGGNPTGGGTVYDGQYLIIQCWDRALEANEIAWLHANPYGLVSPNPYSINVPSTFNASGSGSPGTITLSVPTASAYEVINATGTGSPGTVTLTSPTGTGGTSATGSGSIGTILLSVPTAEATTPSNTGSGDIGTIWLYAPTATPFGPPFAPSLQGQHYWGRFARGQTMNVLWNPESEPDDVATVDFWLEGTTIVKTIQIPILDDERPVFGYPYMISADFEDGNYAAVIRFTSTSASYCSIGYFEVRGGVPYAPVIGLLEIERTLGRAAVTQDRTGDILIGYHPTISTTGLD